MSIEIGENKTNRYELKCFYLVIPSSSYNLKIDYCNLVKKIMLENKSIKISEEIDDEHLKSYSAKDPDHPNWYIYEYGNHRKVLVEINVESGKIHFLKEL